MASLHGGKARVNDPPREKVFVATKTVPRFFSLWKPNPIFWICCCCCCFGCSGFQSDFSELQVTHTPQHQSPTPTLYPDGGMNFGRDRLFVVLKRRNSFVVGQKINLNNSKKTFRKLWFPFQVDISPFPLSPPEPSLFAHHSKNRSLSVEKTGKRAFR